MHPSAARAVDRIGRTVRRTPDAVAVEDAGTTLTYAALWRLAGDVAIRLRAAEVQPGQRAVVAARPGCRWVAAMVGIWRAGAVYVPTDTSFPRERLRFVVTDCGARLLLSDQRSPAAPPASGVRTLRLTAARRGPAGDPDRRKPDADQTSDAAYAIYTSGTTGVPKAVLVGHEALAHRMRHLAATYRLRSTDRIAQLASPAFDASLWEVLLAFEAGACLCIPSGADRAVGPALVRWLAEQQITALTCTPSVLAALPEADLPTLRLIALGGEELHPGPLRYWITRHQVANPYGPTEATIEALVAPHVGMEEPAPIGRPLPGVHAHVLDQAQRPVPAGGVGELYLG
ncbi:MAG: AMP-binding protein, partial [Actinobacteria bacterium]|nr:AMP-binding protein [Actinomycetota bacterium]